MVFGKGPYSLCENFPTLIIAQKQPQIINKHKNIWLCFSTTLFKKTSSVQFSCSVVSNSFQPHELQHARPPRPSTTSGVYPNSCPLSRWCHPAIYPLSSPSPPAPNPSQSFPMSQLNVIQKSMWYTIITKWRIKDNKMKDMITNRNRKGIWQYSRSIYD